MKIDSAKRSMTPVIIPAYEPDERLIQLCTELSKKGFDVVVVDDGSGKYFQEIFENIRTISKCAVLKHAINLGKGRALKTAFNYCLNEYGGVGVITADSDGQHRIEDIIRCADELISYPSSLILGCRRFDNMNIPWKSRFGNNLTKISFQYLCGLKISDTQTGLRGIPTEFLKTLLSTPGERFEYETNMLLEAKDEVDIREISISTIYESKDNHQTHFDPFKDSLMIYKIILSYSLTSVISTIIDYIVFALANGFGGSIGLSTALGRCCAAIVNFTLNRNVVFKSGGEIKIQLIKYVALVVFSGFISATLITKLSQLTPIDIIGLKAIVEVCLFFFNYWIQRTFIFVKKEMG